MSAEHKGPIGSNHRYENNKSTGKLIEDPSTFDWDTEINKKSRVVIEEKEILWAKDAVLDFFGNYIEIGSRAIRVHSYDHYKSFKRITIKQIDLTRKHDPVGFITDGNTRMGWTFPSRIIVQDSLICIV